MGGVRNCRSEGVRHHGAAGNATVTTPGLPTDQIVAAFSDAFIAMSIVAAIGIFVAFWTRDDVLKEHQASERAMQMSGLEGSTGGGS